MPSFSRIAFPALLAVTKVAAQVPFAKVWIYGSEQCAGDSFGISDSLSFYDNQLVTAGANGGFQGTCGFKYIDVGNEWEKNSQGNYDVHIDTSDIPSDCQVIFYNGAPTDDAVSSGDCWAFKQLVSSGQSCPAVTIAGKFGYSMCCGADNCRVASDAPTTGPSKREIAPVKASAEASTVRDVAAIKRSPPLDSDRLSRRDCTFSGSGKSIITYGPQVRVSAPLSCANSAGCTQDVDVTYESSVSHSWGTGVSAGGSLFEVLSVSVEFTYQYTEEQSKSYSYKQGTTIDGDSQGYLTFSPRIECSPTGTFSGGCDWDEGVEGDGCFPINIGELPDGRYQYVIEST